MRARATIAAVLLAAVAALTGSTTSSTADVVASVAFSVRPDAWTPHFGTLCSATIGSQIVTRVAGVGWYREPAWSPDGSRLAFVDGRPVGPVIWSVRPDGTGRRRIAPGESPAWSPDGRQLALTYGQRLYVVDVDRGELRPLSDLYAADPAWAPDGRTLAFTTANGEGVELALLDVATRTVRVLENARLYGFSYEPSWSPDGTRLAVHGGRILRAADGAEVESFGEGVPGYVDEVAWSPDGKRIAYSAVDSSSLVGRGVYVEELETGSRLKVTPDEWEDRSYLLEGDVSWRTAAGRAGTNQPCVVIARESGERIPGTTRDDLVIGGPGNDVVSGGKGNDFVYGGAGDDVLDGGPSRDALRGAEGNDRILARDGSFDRISGGIGRDTALVDRQELTIFQVESIRRP